MPTTSKIFVSCLFGLVLPLVSGCGGGTPSLTPAEQAEVDKYIADYGTRALAEYMDTVRRREIQDEERVLKYVKYFISKGADINVRSSGYTPLDNAKCANYGEGHPTVIKYLESKGAK